MNSPHRTRYLPVLLLVTVAAVVASPTPPDPIPNSAFADRAAGWFDAEGQTCSRICGAESATAEGEQNTARPVAVSYVCKVREASGGTYQWLFGTQFGNRPACYTTDRDLEGAYSDVFYCLCSKAQQRRRRN